MCIDQQFTCTACHWCVCVCMCNVDDHDATSVSSSTQDWHEKRHALMASIEASLPFGLSKNQRKKQLKVKYREATKEVWRYAVLLSHVNHAEVCLVPQQTAEREGKGEETKEETTTSR